MPFARLTLIPAPAPETAQILAAALTDIIAGDLHKNHALTSVLVETPGMSCWTIGGHEQQVAAHLEVYVTAGTNAEVEKRMFVANALRLLQQKLPSLAEATYVIVTELPGCNWGYDGQTQADRARARALDPV